MEYGHLLIELSQLFCSFLTYRHEDNKTNWFRSFLGASIFRIGSVDAYWCYNLGFFFWFVADQVFDLVLLASLWFVKALFAAAYLICSLTFSCRLGLQYVFSSFNVCIDYRLFGSNNLYVYQISTGNPRLTANWSCKLKSQNQTACSLIPVPRLPTHTIKLTPAFSTKSPANRVFLSVILY